MDKTWSVIRLSLKKDVNFEQLGLKALFDRIEELSKNRNIPVTKTTARDQFRAMIQVLGQEQKIVVLIDEYDAPIIHYLGKNLGKAEDNRELLKGFFSVLKELDALIELVFLTGVSKFSKVGIFSGLNNLRDLTMDAQYATMLGYTQEELESNFVEEIEMAAEKLKLSRVELLEQMRIWYNGYRFEEDAASVYNPVSTNLFFEQQKFQNFWFATGTPSFHCQCLKAEGVFDLHFPATSLSGFRKS